MEEKKGKEIEWMLRMDSNLHKAFLTAAQENDRSPSELVREFMENYTLHGPHLTNHEADLNI